MTIPEVKQLERQNILPDVSKEFTISKTLPLEEFLSKVKNIQDKYTTQVLQDNTLATVFKPEEFAETVHNIVNDFLGEVRAQPLVEKEKYSLAIRSLMEIDNNAELLPIFGILKDIVNEKYKEVKENEEMLEKFMGLSDYFSRQINNNANANVTTQGRFLAHILADKKISVKRVVSLVLSKSIQQIDEENKNVDVDAIENRMLQEIEDLEKKKALYPPNNYLAYPDEYFEILRQIEDIFKELEPVENVRSKREDEKDFVGNLKTIASTKKGEPVDYVAYEEAIAFMERIDTSNELRPIMALFMNHMVKMQEKGLVRLEKVNIDPKLSDQEFMKQNKEIVNALYSQFQEALREDDNVSILVKLCGLSGAIKEYIMDMTDTQKKDVEIQMGAYVKPDDTFDLYFELRDTTKAPGEQVIDKGNEINSERKLFRACVTQAKKEHLERKAFRNAAYEVAGLEYRE